MLLSCLQRHAQCAVTMYVDAYSDDAAGNGAFEFIFGSEESSMRSAETNRNSKTLSIAYSCICIQFTGRSQQSERHQVCRHHHKSTGFMNTVDERTIVADISITIRVLYNGSEITAVDFCFCKISENQFNANWRGPCDQHIFCLR